MEIVVAVLLIILIIFGYWLYRIEKKLRMLFGGTKEKNPEALLWEHSETLGRLARESTALREAVGSLEKNFLRSVQKIGVIRFNPFSDSGGDQSFSIVLLDGENNGITLSGIYAQGRPLVYAKPIERGVSRYALSGEEKEALGRALDSR